jgi:hypothetical protein
MNVRLGGLVVTYFHHPTGIIRPEYRGSFSSESVEGSIFCTGYVRPTRIHSEEYSTFLLRLALLRNIQDKEAGRRNRDIASILCAAAYLLSCPKRAPFILKCETSGRVGRRARASATRHSSGSSKRSSSSSTVERQTIVPVACRRATT